MSTQAHQMAECSLEEEHEGVEAVELHPHGENTGPTLNKNNRVQRNFNQSGSRNLNRERQNDATTIGQLLRTVTEVLEGEPIEISIPNIKRTQNLPNGMHNSKLMVSMVGQY